MRLDQRTTNGIQALKLIRPRTEPSIKIGVIAANTNWKYASVAVGKWNGGPVVIDGIDAWPSKAPAFRIDAGFPQKWAKKPLSAPRMCIGVPNDILNANRTHTINTSANAMNDII